MKHINLNILIVNLFYLTAFLPVSAQEITDNTRPNILWITTEDHGPHLGAYGDSYAYTPAMDFLANRGLRYDIAWSNAPVCAPARTAIITGIYPTSTGGQHMRSDVALPDFIRKYPAILRDAGYYVTNNSKEDYNVTSHEKIWNESSAQAHYKNRANGQPFFAVFNLTESHESRIRNRTELPYHNPESVPIPPYHPDTPEVRRDWAQYYHSIYEVDKKVKEILDELEKAGLTDDTIVFFYSDHGSGMPRHKRWPYNSGLHVPFIVHVPDKFQHLAPLDYQHGGSTQRPVSFVDLAPTLLSIVNIKPPDWMQGKAFMGHYEAEPHQYLFGFRGRMDERSDMVRSVRNDRYVYVRNYMPHVIYGQYLAYMWLTETTGIWEEMYDSGILEPPQTYFWEPKPVEELYDLQNDPYEVNNLADSIEHREIIEELRQELHKHYLSTNDTGFLTEAEMHRRAKASGKTIYEMAHDPNQYSVERIVEFAGKAANRNPAITPELIQALEDADPAIRYWAVTGILIRGEEAFDQSSDHLRVVLNDENPSVQIAAADVLMKFGTAKDVSNAVDKLIQLAPADNHSAFISISALNILADLDENMLNKIRPAISEMATTDRNLPARPNDYVHRIVSYILDENR